MATATEKPPRCDLIRGICTSCSKSRVVGVALLGTTVAGTRCRATRCAVPDIGDRDEIRAAVDQAWLRSTCGPAEMTSCGSHPRIRKRKGQRISATDAWHDGRKAGTEIVLQEPVRGRTRDEGGQLEKHWEREASPTASTTGKPHSDRQSTRLEIGPKSWTRTRLSLCFSSTLSSIFSQMARRFNLAHHGLNRFFQRGTVGRESLRLRLRRHAQKPLCRPREQLGPASRQR